MNDSDDDTLADRKNERNPRWVTVLSWAWLATLGAFYYVRRSEMFPPTIFTPVVIGLIAGLLVVAVLVALVLGRRLRRRGRTTIAYRPSVEAIFLPWMAAFLLLDVSSAGTGMAIVVQLLTWITFSGVAVRAYRAHRRQLPP